MGQTPQHRASAQRAVNLLRQLVRNPIYRGQVLDTGRCHAAHPAEALQQAGAALRTNARDLFELTTAGAHLGAARAHAGNRESVRFVTNLRNQHQRGRVPAEPDYALALKAIGPAAIKLGQALATRPDLVGAKAADNLVQLQDSLPPAPFHQIRTAVEAALGAPIEQLYSRFDEVPVGAASIAQVHRAMTREGVDVAVKVLRPGIEDEFARALETYEWAAARIEGLGGELQRLRPKAVVAHFRQWTRRELDLQREAHHVFMDVAHFAVADPR